jgi:hypothetical protein
MPYDRAFYKKLISFTINLLWDFNLINILKKQSLMYT